MSCFIVSDAHIDALLTAALIWDVIRDADVQAMGLKLKALNVEAYSTRYRGDHDEELDRYEFQKLRGKPDPAIIYVAAQCYDYQTCELNDWDKREGHVGLVRRFLDELKDECAKRGLPGYDRAPWAIEDPADFIPKTMARRMA